MSDAEVPGQEPRDAFEQEVFPAELAEVASRQHQVLGEVRAALARHQQRKAPKEPESADDEDQLTEWLDRLLAWVRPRPSRRKTTQARRDEARGRRFRFHDVGPSSELGLVGLALSGGGIRSATFNLGFLQSLSERGVFPLVDYLSTVSGGGYLGSCLSSILADERRYQFPLAAEDGKDGPALRHLRNSGNFLASGLVDFVRIPALLLRGILLHVLLLLPYLTLAAWITWWLCGDALVEASESDPGWTAFWRLTAGTATVLATYIVVSPLVERLFAGHSAFAERDHYERSFAFLLLAVLTVGFVQLLPSALSWYHHLRRPEVQGEVSEALQGIQETWWFALAATLLSALFAALGTQARSQLGQRLALAGLGLVAPFIFLALYLAFGEWCVWSAGRSLARPGSIFYDPLAFLGLPVPEEMKASGWWFFTLVVAALALYTWRFVDVNTTSMHGFYRDRLSGAYLLGYSGEQGQELGPNDAQRLSDLGTAAPYHILNAALNLQALNDPDLRDRRADIFFFSKRFVGGKLTGYCPTKKMEKADRRLNLGTAMAISAAAAAPNMGRATSSALVLLMALFNVRLGYWLPNPRRVAKGLWLPGGVGPFFLMRELFSAISNKSAFVNLSDGGHIENLGLYELLRRRAKYIIACDAEADSDLAFGGFANLIRFAKIDLGIDVEIELDDIRRRESGHSRNHCAVGKVRYPPTECEPKGGVGYLLYVKSSVIGEEPETIREYRARHPSFPHESTGDQFFDEAQFESYRSLGYGIAESLFEGAVKNVDAKADTLTAWFRGLETMLRPETAETDVFVGLKEQLTAIESELKSPEMAIYAHQFYPELAPSLPPSAVPSREERRAIFHFVNSQLQLMENVVTALDLNRPGQRRHHLHRGWMNLFNRWAKAPYFRWAWAISIGTYSVSFQDFCEQALGLDLRLDVAPGEWADLTAREQRQLEDWGWTTAAGLKDLHDQVWVGRMVVESATGAAGAESTSFPLGACLLHFEQTDGLRVALRYCAIRSFYRRMGLIHKLLPQVRQRIRDEYPTARTVTEFPLRSYRRVSKLAYLFERHGFPAEDNAIVRLYHSAPQVRCGAARELALFAAEPDVRAALLDRLRSATVREVRAALVEALTGAAEQPEVRSALLSRLYDADESVRAAAASALAAAAEHPEVREALLARLDDPASVLDSATRALTKASGSSDVTKDLVARLDREMKGDDPDRLTDLVRAFPVGYHEITERLVSLLEDKWPAAVRRAAAKALTYLIPDKAFGAMLDDDELCATAVRALGPKDDFRARFFGILRGDGDATADSRQAVAEVLSQATHKKEVRDALVQRLDDETEALELRRAAARALAYSSESDAVAELLRRLDDPRRLVRETAAKAVGRAAADPGAWDSLPEDVLNELLEPFTHGAATRSLISALAPAVDDVGEVRGKLLALVRGKLLALVDDDELKIEAISALAGAAHRPEVREVLLAQLGGDDWRTREAAARALRREACHREVLTALVGRLEVADEEPVLCAAVEALEDMAYLPEVRDFLLCRLGGEPWAAKPDLLQAAARVLGRGGYPPPALARLVALLPRDYRAPVEERHKAALRAMAGAIHQAKVADTFFGLPQLLWNEISGQHEKLRREEILPKAAAERSEVRAALLARRDNEALQALAETVEPSVRADFINVLYDEKKRDKRGELVKLLTLYLDGDQEERKTVAQSLRSLLDSPRPEE